MTIPLQELRMLTKKCMQACINSYEGEYGKIKKLFNDAKRFNKNGVNGFIAEDGHDLYIVFEGSDGTGDWIDNLKFWQKNVYKGVKVHAGFYYQFMQVETLINKAVVAKIILDSKARIIIIGHSLGAALATLTCLEVADYKPVCITFGSPRVGNWKFARLFNKKILHCYRYVNGDDVVCKVPYMWMNYKHVGKKVRIGKRKWYNYLFGSREDHYPQKYLKNLK